jgi:hypothetical protein
MIDGFIITELSPTPPAGEPEWVECVNATARRIDLDGWMICDERSCVPLPSGTVAPGSTVVFTRDASALRESRWIPGAVEVVEVALPSLNNTSDRITLVDPSGAVMDAVTYDVRRHVKGRSIERTGQEDARGVSYADAWATCQDRDSATCGRANSVIVRDRDLRVASITALDRSVDVQVVNQGRRAEGGVRFTLSIGSHVFTRTVDLLEPQMPWTMSVRLADLDPEPAVTSVQALAVVHVRDDRPENDTAAMVLMLPPAPGGLVVNEVMFDPLAGRCDWVEIMNRTTDTVDLDGWVITDAASDAVTITGPARVAPGALFVVASDTSIAADVPPERWTVTRPMLRINATEDLLVLRTPSGFAADSLRVDADDHHPHLPSARGTSLEKRHPGLPGTDPSSWTSSAEITGSSPGMPNSVLRAPSEHGTMRAHPSVLSSDPARRMAGTEVTWRIPFLQAVARVSVVTPDGRFVRDLVREAFIGAEGGVAWDGADGSGQRVPPGPYVVVLECVNASSHAVHRDRCLVVVGE